MDDDCGYIHTSIHKNSDFLSCIVTICISMGLAQAHPNYNYTYRFVVYLKQQYTGSNLNYKGFISDISWHISQL